MFIKCWALFLRTDSDKRTLEFCEKPETGWDGFNCLTIKSVFCSYAQNPYIFEEGVLTLNWMGRFQTWGFQTLTIKKICNVDIEQGSLAWDKNVPRDKRVAKSMKHLQRARKNRRNEYIYFSLPCHICPGTFEWPIKTNCTCMHDSSNAGLFKWIKEEVYKTFWCS